MSADIQPGDVVLATWFSSITRQLDIVDFPALHSHVGRVTNICDHYSERAGVKKHEGTSVLFEGGRQLPLEYCRVLVRPVNPRISG